MPETGSDKENVTVPSARGYRIVSTTFEVQGGARRNIESLTIRPSGLAQANVSATELIGKIVEKSHLDPDGFVVVYGIDEENGVIAVYPAKSDELGAMPVRPSKDRKRLSLHLGGVFREFPSLRPGFTKECRIIEKTDPKGVTCLLVSVGTGLAKVKRRSGGSAVTRSETGTAGSAI